MYGPWPKIRNLYVNTAMKTMDHQYLANVFYSEEQINTIVSNNYFITIEEDTNTDNVIIDTKEKTNYKDKYEEELFTREYHKFNNVDKELCCNFDIKELREKIKERISFLNK
jgi:exopolysaccharide biosynthesis protein